MRKVAIYQRQNQTLNMLGILGGGSSSIYSTTEEEAGEWINGKPIYRKVFPLGTITDATETLGTTNTVYSTTNQLLNVDIVVKGLLIGTDDDLSANYAVPVYVFVKDNYVYFSTWMTMNTTAGTNYLSVEYTKTTDQSTNT